MRIKALAPSSLLLLALFVGCQAKPTSQEAVSPGAGAPPPAATPQTAPPATAPAPAAPAATATATAPAPAAQTTPAAPPPAPAPAAAPTAAGPVTTPTPAAPGAATPPAAAAPAAAVATQTSNWPGVVADVTEFRRKGSTLTVRVVLRNQGNVDSEPDIHYTEVYVMDLGAGKKYEVLKDEKGTYIAALRSGYSNRWYEKLAPGASYTLWMKFPAPPPEVKSVTLQLPGMPPFEDVPIQDS